MTRPSLANHPATPLAASPRPRTKAVVARASRCPPRSHRRAASLLGILATGALALSLPTDAAGASDWPQWRGPNRDGRSTVTAPATWPATLTRQWSVAVGGGHANPVIAGDWIYIHARDGEDETVTAYALADGRRDWSDRYPLAFQPTAEAAEHGKGPFATPLVADGRLFTFGMDQVLTAYRAESGERLWRNDYRPSYPVARPYYGNSWSPLVADGKLIVYVGGPGKGALLALDPATGRELWRTEGDGPPYASPLIVEIAGGRQILTQTQATIGGYDLATGRRLWSTPYVVDWDNTIVTPAVAGDTFFLSAWAKPLEAFRIARRDDTFTVAATWSHPEHGLNMSSPVLVGEQLWVFTRTKKGQLVAIEPATGAARWTSEPGLGEHASLVALDGALLVLGVDGTLRVVATTGNGAPRVAATYQVASSPTWSHPVPLADGLLVRDATTLTRLRW